MKPSLLPYKGGLNKAGGLSRQVQIHVKYSLMPDKIGLIRQLVLNTGFTVNDEGNLSDMDKHV